MKTSTLIKLSLVGAALLLIPRRSSQSAHQTATAPDNDAAVDKPACNIDLQ